MKKRGIVLSILFAICAVVLPMRANAAGLIFASTDENFTSTMLNADETAVTGTIVVENQGANSKVYIGVKATSDIPARTSFTATINLSESNWKFGRSICTNVPGSGWSVRCEKVSDTQATITATSTVAMTASTPKKIISQVNLDGSEGTSTQGCRITLGTGTAPESPKCKIDGDKYYCANGEECTKDEYNKICVTSENPQTGSFIPYAVIIGGIAVAIGLYMITKKNKIYHI